ncbi:Fc receptor-like protein 5 [Nelusetta ayraudi]|uniref:Fc receptor-like protein 5 n=1 Tax=Nelusetta ayraudi TaxID=303726 RepID=UPI003F6EA255
MTSAILVVLLGLGYCSSESDRFSLGIPELQGPSVAFVGDIISFKCSLSTYPENELFFLKLIRKGNRDKILGEYTSLYGDAAEFPRIIKLADDGNLQCMATAQNNSNIQPTVSKDHYLKVIEEVKDPEIDIVSGSAVLFEGELLELHCSVKRGTYVFYEWLVNSRPVSPSSLHQGHVYIRRTSPQDSGSYVCIASNVVNNLDDTLVHAANSSEVVITVKAVVSKPEISFAVLKKGPRNYSVTITCQSSEGTPPIAFSLYNSTQLVANVTADDRYATFKVPLVFSRHMGWFACQANNGNRIAYSERIPIEIVPVGGPVTMSYEYDIGENYAVIGLRLYCQAAKGSHLRYQWFLDEMLLHNQDSFYVVDQLPERSMLLLSVGWGSAGTYHCKVSDSFDNTTVIRSKKLYIDREVLNRLPPLVQVVVFGCFTFLVLLVSFCCCAGVLISECPQCCLCCVLPMTNHIHNTVFVFS